MDYEEQLSAAKYKAERDQARQEAERWKRDVDNRRVELCSCLGIDTGTGWSDAVAEMDKRLMPPGYEWPRFDDGEPVLFGDETSLTDAVTEVSFLSDGSALIGDCHGDFSVDRGERIKRPKPDPIGADGLPIKNGETARGTGRSQHEFEVLDTHDINPEVGSRFSVKCFDKNDGEVCWCDPKLLTHAKPEPIDSWERLDEDARELDINLDGENTSDYPRMSCVRDLVRRAKALAGVSE